MRYEAWKDSEAWTLACPETIAAQRTAGLIQPNAQRVHVIEAETHAEAVRKLHELEDWGEPRPTERTAEVMAVEAWRHLLYGGPFG